MTPQKVTKEYHVRLGKETEYRTRFATIYFVDGKFHKVEYHVDKNPYDRIDLELLKKIAESIEEIEKEIT